MQNKDTEKTIDTQEVVDETPQKITADLRKFNSTQAMVTKAMAALKAIVVADQPTCDAALVTLKEASTVEKKIEAKRKELVAPFNAAVSKINDKAKEIIKELPGAITAGKQKILDWQAAEQKKAKEAKIKAREESLNALGFVKADGVWTYPKDPRDVFDVNIAQGMVDNYPDESWADLYEDKKASIDIILMARQTRAQEDLEELETFGSEEQIAEAKESLDQARRNHIMEDKYILAYAHVRTVILFEMRFLSTRVRVYTGNMNRDEQEAAFVNWISRTNDRSEQSFCDYINKKRREGKSDHWAARSMPEFMELVKKEGLSHVQN